MNRETFPSDSAQADRSVIPPHSFKVGQQEQFEKHVTYMQSTKNGPDFD